MPRVFCYAPGLDQESAAAVLCQRPQGPVHCGETVLWYVDGPTLTGASQTPPSDVRTAIVSDQLIAAKRKLFVLDVDSTLIAQEVIDLLAAHAGTEAKVRNITAAAMRGELDFEQSLRSRVETLAGLPVSVLAQVQAAVQFSPGARKLIAGVHAAGHRVAAVSGGFTQILTPLAARLNLDACLANELEIRDGQLTGRVSGAVVDRAAKAAALRQWAAEAGVPQAATIAIGDGANDLDMLAAAGLSLAYQAKPSVRRAAMASIDRLDLALPLSGTGYPLFQASERPSVQERVKDSAPPTSSV